MRKTPVIVVLVAVIAVVATFAFRRGRVATADQSSVGRVVADAKSPDPFSGKAPQEPRTSDLSVGKTQAAMKAAIGPWEAGGYKIPKPGRLDKEAMEADRRYASYRAKNTGRWVELSYGAAFKRLGLLPAQINRIRQLLAERELSLTEFDSLAGKSSSTKEGLAEARQSAVSGIDAGIVDLVGKDVYEQLKASRERVGRLTLTDHEAGADLSIAGYPLSPEQAEALAKVYSQRRPLPGAPASNTGLPADLQRMFEKARFVLSPEQLTVFMETLQLKAERERFIADHIVRP